MTPDQKKAAIAAHKEKVTKGGIFSLKCQGTGQIWVGRALNIDNYDRQFRFSLNTGRYPHPGLQAAWNAAGEGQFVFELREVLEEAASEYLYLSHVKARWAHWCEILGASRI